MRQVAASAGAGYDRGVMRWLAPLFSVAASAALAAGCWSPVTELVTPHVEAGGAIMAALANGPSLTTTAIADSTVDPMTITGNSPTFVFGLIVGNDSISGMPAKAMLLASDGVTLTIAAGSQLSVHMNGQNCAATAATVNLRPDGKGNIDGDFTATGDGCSTDGTLTAVPINQ
jgi:hypothetical protein